MSRQGLQAGLAIALVATTGCAQMSAGMARLAPVSMRPPDATYCPLREPVRSCSARQREAYASRALEVANDQTFLFDLPIIGAAIASSLALAFDGGTTLALSLGGVGATFGAFRTLSNAGGQTLLYGKAERQTLCVDQQLLWFDAHHARIEEVVESGRKLAPLVADAKQLLANHENRTAPIPFEQLVLSLRAAVASGEASMRAAKTVEAAERNWEVQARWSLNTIHASLKGEIQEGRPDISAVIKTVEQEIGAIRSSRSSAAESEAEGKESANRLQAALQETPSVPERVDRVIKAIRAVARFVEESAPEIVKQYEGIRGCTART